MPTLQLPSLTDSLEGRPMRETVECDIAYIVGVMCRPKNDRVARKLVKHHRLDAMIRDLRQRRKADRPLPQIDTDTMLDAVDHVSAKENFFSALSPDRLPGFSSGLILRWVLSRAEDVETRDLATVNKAADEVQKWLRHHRLSGATRNDTVKKWWRRHRSVSHLWAAWQMIGERSINIESRGGFRSLLEIARDLRERGTKILPHRASPGENLLSKDTWQIPAGLPVGPFVFWSDYLDAHDLTKMPAPSFPKC